MHSCHSLILGTPVQLIGWACHVDPLAVGWGELKFAKSCCVCGPSPVKGFFCSAGWSSCAMTSMYMCPIT